MSRRRKNTRGAIVGVLREITILPVLLFMVGPFIWMIIASFKPTQEIFTKVPKLLPTRWTLEHYLYVFQGSGEASFGREFLNSGIVTLAAVIAALIVGSLAAYGLSRFQRRWTSGALVAIMSPQFFPGVLTLIPLFMLFQWLGLIDTHIALVMVYMTFALPISTWLLKAFFDRIPVEMEEAALMDGCTRLQAMLRIVLPLSIPSLTAVGIFIMIGVWKELMIASIFLHSEKLITVPLGLMRLVQMEHSRLLYGPLLAKSLLAAIPVIVLFVYFQKYFVQGLTKGAIK